MPNHSVSCLVTLVLVSGVSAFAQEAPSLDRIFRGDSLSVGEILLRGEPGVAQDPDGEDVDVCVFPDFMIGLEDVAFGTSKAINLRVDVECNLIVADRVAEFEQAARFRGGELLAGPKDYRLRNIAAATLPVAPFRRTTSSIYNEVTMYGYGGEWDWLTRNDGYMSYEWWSEGATHLLSYDTECSAHWITGWVNLSCDDDAFVQEYGDTVGRMGEGFYLWLANPSLYSHSLYDMEFGGSWGGDCYYSFSGGIVAGIYYICSVF